LCVSSARRAASWFDIFSWRIEALAQGTEHWDNCVSARTIRVAKAFLHLNNEACGG
jgi:hypothetical protein